MTLRPWLFSLFVIGAHFLFPVPASAQAIGSQIETARSLAANCDYNAAIAADDAALAAAQAQWPANSPELAIIHNDLSMFKNMAGDTAAAIRSAEAALALTKNSDQKFATLAALSRLRLGDALLNASRLDEAEPFLKEAVQDFSKTDPAFQIVAQIALSRLELRRDRSAAAVDAAKSAVEIGNSYHSTPVDLRRQAILQLIESLRKSGDTATASELMETLPGAKNEDPRLILTQAGLAMDMGQLTHAQTLVDQAEKLAQQKAGRCDLTLDADILQRRGTVHLLRREIGEAKGAFTFALQKLGDIGMVNDPRLGEVYFGLADAAYLSGEFDVSLRLFDKASDNFRKSYGPASSAVGNTLIERSYVQSIAGDPNGALQTAVSGRNLVTQSGSDSILSGAYANVAIGIAYKQLGQYEPARAAFRIAIEGIERVRGPLSLDLAPSLLSLGEISLRTGSPQQAIQPLEKALKIQSQTGALTPLAAGLSYMRLAQAYDTMGEKAKAMANSRLAVDTLERRIDLGEAQPWMDAEAERRRSRDIVDTSLKLPFSASGAGRVSDSATFDELFRTVQLASSLRTGAAIAQMSRRLQSGDDALAQILKQRDDLTQRWRILESNKNGLYDRLPGKSGDEGQQIASQQSEILDNITAIDAKIERDFPQISLIIKSPIVRREEALEVLHEGEALLTITVMDDSVYICALTTRDNFCYNSVIARSDLESIVAHIRETIIPKYGDRYPPQFDADAAYKLYGAILQPVLSTLKNIDTLLIIADAPISSIPLTTLITSQNREQPKTAKELSALPWLIKSYAVDQFPSIASFVILRRLSRPKAPANSFLGFGAPQLSGSKSDTAPIVTRSLGESRLANPAVLKSLPPLPDSEREIEEIADTLGKGSSKLMLGAAATETQVKTIKLDKYRIIAFATHGLIAGDLKGYDEAALVMTPPLNATAQDDGLLSASEVATLHLDADWVILSACNTANGAAGDAEPLTGLAKAFFYAGARSLLVSHWPISSSSAAQLTTQTVAGVSRGLNSAQALRAAQMKMIDDEDGSKRTHPYFWAAFSLIGSSGM